MADDSSSGFRSRIQGIDEALPFQQPSCPTLSSVLAHDESKESSFLVPSPKQGQEIIQSFEKVRGSSETNCSVGDSQEAGREESGGDESPIDGVNFNPCETFAGSSECEGSGEVSGENMEPSGLSVEKEVDFDKVNRGGSVNDVNKVKEEVAMKEEDCVDGVVGSDGIEGLEGSGDVDVEVFLESKKKQECHVGEARNMVAQVGGTQTGGGKTGDEKQRKFSREEMEALRFVNIVEQQQTWRHLFSGLQDTVLKEYGDLTITKKQKNIRSNLDSSRRVGRKQGGPGFIGERSSQNVNNESEIMDKNEVEKVDILDASHSSRSEDNLLLEEGYSGEDDSDEEHTRIQKPAFLVEGEPDFESGPPEDGLEYLRRVRWEAAHIPKVKVARLDRNKIVKEQSVYMPPIPDIAKCPENLLPSKQWEDEFLADFSKLRLKLQFQEQNPFSPQLTDSIVLEKFHDFATDGAQFSVPLDGTVSTSSQCPSSKAPTVDSAPKYPTVASILAMDCVARAANLKEHIELAETRNTLSKNECLWLFALCAAVDTPADADTCAALRNLLRKCASLRAAKSELDDEVIMLNILATICGRFFGQSES